MEKLFRKNQDFNYAVSLYYLGFSYFDLEKFSDAKEELLKCNEMLKDESIQNQSNDLKIKVMDLLGRCYFDLGVFDESESALKEALELKKKQEFPQSWMIPTLINLSKAQAEMNKFNDALENANLALDLDEPDGSHETLGIRDQVAMFAPLTEHPRIAECLLYLGILNIDLGEYVTAQRFVIHWSNNYIENNLIWPFHPFCSGKFLIYLSYCGTTVFQQLPNSNWNFGIEEK